MLSLFVLYKNCSKTASVLIRFRAEAIVGCMRRTPMAQADPSKAAGRVIVAQCDTLCQVY